MGHVKSIYIHPAPVRVWHWLNAFFCIVLVITGLQLRFAEIFTLLALQDAVKLHNYAGFGLIANYGLWVAFYFGTGKIRVYLPDPRSLVQKAIAQTKYYGSGIFKGEENPHQVTPSSKFNVLQQQAYISIMFLFLPAQMISGLFLWRIKNFEQYITLLGGIKIVDTFHVLIFYFFASFMMVHAYLATLGHTPTAHYKAMFTGYEEMHQ
jgi:thiosulfate reductase cytochrome b subunit